MYLLEENNKTLRFERLKDMLEYIENKINQQEIENKEYELKLYSFE